MHWLKICIFYSCLFLGSSYCCLANVESSSGVINFDANRDSTPELIVNTTGLGIGIAPNTKLDVDGSSWITGNQTITGSLSSNNFDLRGAFAMTPLITSSNTTAMDNALIMAGSSSANIDVTLPNPASCTGRIYQVINTSTSNVYVSSNVSINGAYSHVSVCRIGNA
jgi:hypothetical protein